MRTTPREVRDYINIKENFSLSEIQKIVLLGTLLGDGSLKCRGNYHRLHIKHSKRQLSLVEYKHKIFSDITTMPIRIFSQEVKNKVYEFCEFVTLTHPEFSEFHRWFYPDGTKRITQKILKEFNNPLSLAVWFMDDGCADYAGVSFNTQCFTKEEVDLLRGIINNNFNIETTSRRNKNGWIIYVPKKHMDLFRSLVEKHMLPKFLYKLHPYSERK